MYKAVIFDFDGTIANTQAAVLRIFDEFAVNNDLPRINESYIEELRNKGARELFKELNISPLKLIQLTKYVHDNLRDQMKNVEPMEGIVDVLLQLKKRQLKLGIVTSNAVENVKLFLQQHQITSIDFVHSERKLFGKSRSIKKALKQQQLQHTEAIYVGDEVRDIEAAREVPMDVIAVAWGLNTKERLHKAAPDYLIDHPAEILTLIEST
jgi:phosphoglycolate phosphatase